MRMVDEMYADNNNPEIANDEYFANRTILTTTNAVVQRINEAVAQLLEGVSQEYLSTDSVEEDEEVNFFEQEVLHCQHQWYSTAQADVEKGRSHHDNAEFKPRPGVV
ncbi:hypothetical protein PC121_g23143 [Phytophthora cactorum]|nr:hypothetical protein PC121_g23143 [Phytophthora cactorum]